MKKRTTLILASLLAIVCSVSAQENLIMGGSMEVADAEYWKTATLETDTSTNTSEFTFGYTEVEPTGGDEGCLHYTITNTGTGGAHLMFYQEVTIERGVPYIFDLHIKSIQEMNSSWVEAYIGEDEPTDTADYGSGSTPLGGFKWADWADGCENMFDGTIQLNGCIDGSQGSFTIEGEGEVQMFIGFKSGIWAMETEIEFVLDNVSLTKQSTTAITEDIQNTFSVYPNPVNNYLNILSDTEIVSATIYNVVGQKVMTSSDISTSLNVSEINSGIYIVELVDNANHKEFHRFQKN